MTILFYQLGINPIEGGVQRVTWTVADGLSKMGHEVLCIYNFASQTALGTTPFSDTLLISPAVKGQSLYDTIEEFAIRHRVDVIVNQSGGDVSMAMLFAKLRDKMRVKLYSFIHISPMGSREVLGYRDWRIPKIMIRSLLKELLIKVYPYDKVAYRKIYELSDKVVLLSKGFIPDFLKLIGHESDIDCKLEAISNPATYAPEDIDLREAKSNCFLVVSRMGDSPKRLLRVIDTWKKIQDELPDWKIIFVGDGDNLNDYKRIASTEGLKRIEFTGMQKPEKYYRESAIFLMTSATEGFGMTILEAQQHGCVPVAMDTYRALHDLIQDGYNGIITPKGDIDMFAKACVRLATDETIRRQMSENAQKRSRNFSKDIILKQWQNLLSC